MTSVTLLIFLPTYRPLRQIELYLLLIILRRSNPETKSTRAEWGIQSPLVSSKCVSLHYLSLLFAFEQIYPAEGHHGCPTLDLSTQPLISVPLLLTFVTRVTHCPGQPRELVGQMAGGTAWHPTAVSID